MGNKMNDIDIVYTMWANLKKTPSMEVNILLLLPLNIIIDILYPFFICKNNSVPIQVGQVAFHKDKEVRKVRVVKRINEIINRLNKTKREAFPDLRLERETRDRLEREDKKKILRDKKEKEKEEEKRKKEEAELRSYATLMKKENMSTNYDGNDSDDFM